MHRQDWGLRGGFMQEVAFEIGFEKKWDLAGGNEGWEGHSKERK